MSCNLAALTLGVFSEVACRHREKVNGQSTSAMGRVYALGVEKTQSILKTALQHVGYHHRMVILATGDLIWSNPSNE